MLEEIIFLLIVYSPVILLIGWTAIFIGWVYKKNLKSIQRKNGRGIKRTKKYENKNTKIHPEYLDLIKEVVEEKKEKEMNLNTLNLLNRKVEGVQRIDKEIEELLKTELLKEK